MSDLADGSHAEFQGLPGGDLVHQGLMDMAAGVESMPALLVAIGRPRLYLLGLMDADDKCDPVPEIRLYRYLGRENPREAYLQYNVLIRRLVSFERAMERRKWSGQ